MKDLKPKGYWNIKENIINEALKYSSKIEFKRECGSAYTLMCKNGLISECCSHMTTFSKPYGYWTFEKVKEEALKYISKSDFKKGCGSAYHFACTNKWLDLVCVHMANEKKPNGYWTLEKLLKEALLYSNRASFYENSKSAYQIAYQKNLLDTICSHMIEQGNIAKRYIYKVTFPDNSIYIGLTFDFDKRKRQHLNNKKSAIYKYILKTNTQPIFELITELLNINEAAKMEKKLIYDCKKLNINLLNKNNGGGLGSCNGRKQFIISI